MKKQSSVAEKQYQKFDDVFESNKKEEKIKRSRAKSNLVYSKDFNFYKYKNTNKFAKLSFYSKQNDLIEFKDALETLYYDTEEIKPNNEAQEKTLKKRKIVISTASKLYYRFLNVYTTQYNKLSEDSKKRINVLNKSEMLVLHFDRDDLLPMASLESDEEIKSEPEETSAERLKLNPQNHVYINRINNRLVFQIKIGYKLELQTPKTIKLFGSTKKLIDKTKNGENVPSLEVVEVALVQCNLVDTQCQ